MRTLCVACHYDVTAAQCAERRLTRAKAKKQLKVIMHGLKHDQTTKETEDNVEVFSYTTDFYFEVYHLGKI